MQNVAFFGRSTAYRFLVCAAGALALTLAAADAEARQTHRMIAATDIRSEPSVSGAVVARAEHGASVTVMHSVPGSQWVEISDERGQRLGYVLATTVERIPRIQQTSDRGTRSSALGDFLTGANSASHSTPSVQAPLPQGVEAEANQTVERSGLAGFLTRSEIAEQQASQYRGTRRNPDRPPAGNFTWLADGSLVSAQAEHDAEQRRLAAIEAERRRIEAERQRLAAEQQRLRDQRIAEERRMAEAQRARERRAEQRRRDDNRAALFGALVGAAVEGFDAYERDQQRSREASAQRQRDLERSQREYEARMRQLRGEEAALIQPTSAGGQGGGARPADPPGDTVSRYQPPTPATRSPSFTPPPSFTPTSPRPAPSQQPAQRPVIAMREGVAVCPLEGARLFGEIVCHGPFASNMTNADNASRVASAACGSNSHPARDFGVINNNRVWGCGYGIDPGRSGRAPHLDTARRFNLNIPQRRTYRCPEGTDFCRQQ